MNSKKAGPQTKKPVVILAVIAIVVAALFMRELAWKEGGMSSNAPVDQGEVRQLPKQKVVTARPHVMPLKQVVIYRAQNVSYDNFDAAIFAQGQLEYASSLPVGSEVSLYVEAIKVNGPSGLQAGTRCTDEQAAASYFRDTITMDKRFCPDFNDAILDGRAVYGIVPTEAVFLHKSNGERCYKVNDGNTEYLVNPASVYFREYLVRRSAEKLEQHSLDTLFLDDLRPGWTGIMSACEGAPREYLLPSAYYTELVGLAQYVHDNLPSYKIEGNLATVSSQWDRFAFLDGVMCESCFSNWGGAWPTSSKMISDLATLQTWIDSGKELYVIVYPPDVTESSNRFTFAASLLVAEPDKTYFHFGVSGEFHPLPEYDYDLGLPTGAYICNGSVCSRQFENGLVRVDFLTKKGSVNLGVSQME
ncbi:MAG: hypothetical protein HY865_01070 [Chloroflexi bacterium]|nr:hypothetical protein [Chloroflexota bacterium]